MTRKTPADWANKVNPQRAKAEQANGTSGRAERGATAEHIKGAEALFAELFGAPDAELQAALNDSLARASALGLQMMETA